MQTVKVRLRKPGRVFTFRCNDVSLTRGDACVVRSDRGLEYGVCIVPPTPCSDEMTKRITMLVVRRATEHDAAAFARLAEDEARALDICGQKIVGRGLPMKLVDAEYTFDKSKVVFYFTADQRVDFRDLVRDLAHALKARIELRHIQVRDQARLVGGIGECGRLLCCRTWLREFMPISMKMAKRQNLSLNPEKISGQCGRLMCCLSYEDNLYEDKKKRPPLPRPEPQPPKPEDTADTTPAPEPEEARAAPTAPQTPATQPAQQPVAQTDGQPAAPPSAATAQGSDGETPQPNKSRRRRKRRRKGPRTGQTGQGGNAS